jgi:Putative Ig domain
MASTIHNCFVLILSVVLVTALSGCNDQGSTSPAGFSISGVPQSKVKVGTAYQFRPTATADPGMTLNFSVSNLPAWAQFDPTTGMLSGHPSTADIGVYAKISIAVSNGVASTALAPFSISVESASRTAVTISGNPATTGAAGASYIFRPTATSTTNAKLTFSISHQPPWAKFDTGTGAVSGTPSTSNVGTFADIVISVSDGTDTAALTAFSIVVTQLASAEVNITWTTPTPTADAAASELAGYHIYYGTNSSAMTHVVNVADPKATSHVINELARGTWYFAVASFNTAQIESALSPTLSTQLL